MNSSESKSAIKQGKLAKDELAAFQRGQQQREYGRRMVALIATSPLAVIGAVATGVTAAVATGGVGAISIMAAVAGGAVVGGVPYSMTKRRLIASGVKKDHRHMEGLRQTIREGKAAKRRLAKEAQERDHAPANPPRASIEDRERQHMLNAVRDTADMPSEPRRTREGVSR